MGGSKGSAPTPSGASTTTAASSQGTSQGVFAQGPSTFVSPMYQDFLARAQGLSNTPFNPETQASVAPLNPKQSGSIQQLWDLGMDLGNFDPARVREIESPYIQDVVGASQDWFNNQNAIQGNQLVGQGIRSGNAFGGDRMGVAAAEMAGQQQLAQAPVIAGLYQSGYTQALDEYNKLKQFGITGAEEAIKAGTIEQAQSQRERDVAQQNAMMREAYPFQLANWYGSALGGVGPLTGTVGSAQTVSTSDTSGITNPPTPNPLTQALGIGSSLIGIGGGLGLFKEGGYVGDDDEEDTSNSMFETGDTDSEQQDSQAPDSSSAINPQTGKPKTDYDREIDVISGKTGGAEPPRDFLGQLKVQKFKQPYSVLDRLKNASGGGGGGSSANKTGSTQPSAPAPAAASSGAGKTIGAIGGTIFGGPVGGAIGGAAGSLVDNLFAEGGPVEDDDMDEGDEGDTGDTEDTGDTALTLPNINVSGDMPPTMQVAQAADQPQQTVTPQAVPPDGNQPLVPRTSVESRPSVRDLTYITKPGPGSEPPPPTTDVADRRGYSVQRIPELGPPPKSFADRWASNPFTQAGIAMLGSTSPHLGVGLSKGLGAATGSIAANRKQDLLDAKPQMITQGDTISYRVGDQIIKTNIPTQTRAQKEVNERIRERQKQIDERGKSGSKQADAARDTAIARMATAMQKGDPTMSGEDAYRRSIEMWNNRYPDRALPVPAAPAPAAPKKKPADEGGGVLETLDPAWQTFKHGVVDPAREWWKKPSATAAPAAPAPAPAPTPAPQEAPAPQKAKPPNLTDDLKSGKVTKEQILQDAKKAIDGGKDQSIIKQRLKDAGIDFGELISAPMPGKRPQVPMSQ